MSSADEAQQINLTFVKTPCKMNLRGPIEFVSELKTNLSGNPSHWT